ncbi:GGDEF domain-containing protein [Thermosynechococcus sp. B0]|uniref:sensor domain-containing diguanylate cyclase n=1 Tax=unclassified Thermosynechococcus TaxID=2622553 RepID=UPI0025774E21|nr:MULTISPECIES: GGDEF domain-containing protein [unclassified Thermosynechococcus]WJI23980.1 GGDEF domain-containing protein [Thermosynechococcus sp. B0]WKT83616.1 GGDEF domain-containing protein [Thermosynechococcus sp. HY596]WNC62747.1 GGDEF domain-containing protein [Thermosynechococcus sp. HY591]
MQQHSSHQLLPTPDGITAFCHLIASWFQVDLVLALTVNEAGDRAQIITTSSATPFPPIELRCPWRDVLPAAAVDLTPLLQKKLPSIFLCYLDRIEQLVYLPCGEPAQWRQGLLLINPQANLLGRVTQQKEYIAALYRQLLADHYRNQQNFLFEVQFQDIFNTVPLGLVLIKGDGTTAMVNAYASDWLQLPPGNHPISLVAQHMKQARQRCDNREELERIFADLGTNANFSAKGECQLGEKTVLIDTHPVQGDGRLGRVWIFSDITDMRQREQALLALAWLDPLTGAYNRRFLLSRVEAYETQAASGQTSLAVMIFDIDYFKRINDTYGHDQGDVVLRTLAARAKQVLEACKDGILVRWGGEEFVLLFFALNEDHAKSVAEKLCAVVRSKPIELGDQQFLAATISLGGTLFRPGEQVISDSIPRADQALYKAKHGGRDRWVWI